MQPSDTDTFERVGRDRRPDLRLILSGGELFQLEATAKPWKPVARVFADFSKCALKSLG